MISTCCFLYISSTKPWLRYIHPLPQTESIAAPDGRACPRPVSHFSVGKRHPREHCIERGPARRIKHLFLRPRECGGQQLPSVGHRNPKPISLRPMAKSFEQLTAFGRGVPAKPLSEPDFFDLTAGPEAPTSSPPEVNAEPESRADPGSGGDGGGSTHNAGVKKAFVAGNPGFPVKSSDRVVTDSPELPAPPRGRPYLREEEACGKPSCWAGTTWSSCAITFTLAGQGAIIPIRKSRRCKRPWACSSPARDPLDLGQVRRANGNSNTGRAPKRVANYAAPETGQGFSE